MTAVPHHASTGARLIAADGRALPLKGAALLADAKGGIIRVVLEQTFENPYAEPLTVTYQLPLPADGAVSGFAFTVGNERVVGEVDSKGKARERFEEAVLSGRTAALLEQERSSLFSQKVGNVPPYTQVVCEVTVDQKLSWLADGFWEWRFPTVVAPRYLGDAGRVADAAQVTVGVADAALPVRLALALTVRDRLIDGSAPHSPSHPLSTSKGVGRTEATFSSERGVALDRDVVVRWKAADVVVGAELDAARLPKGPASEAAHALLTLVPPAPRAGRPVVRRDLIVLLDTSGSMSGAPLAQACKVTAALIDALQATDTVELIEFSSSARRFARKPLEASLDTKAKAKAWLAALRASGSTEMRTGILEALKELDAEALRQVVLITDGLIGFESEIVREVALKLPPGCRVHTVGVGSGVNRSLLTPVARAGRGLETIIGLDEDAEAAALRLVAHTADPLVTHLTVGGTALIQVAPRRVADLYAGAPSLVSLALRAEGGTVLISGRTGEGDFTRVIEVKPLEKGEGSAAVARLFARECVEDLELDKAAGTGAAHDAHIEQYGLNFQISTRMTSWVAVSQGITVDPRAATRTEAQPQELPYGMSAEGLGLRSSAPTLAGAPMMSRMRAGAGVPSAAAPAPMGAGGMAPPAKAKAGLFERAKELFTDKKSDRAQAPQEPKFESFDEGMSDDEAPAELERAEESRSPSAPPPPPRKRPAAPVDVEKEPAVRQSNQGPAGAATEQAPSNQGEASPEPTERQEKDRAARRDQPVGLLKGQSSELLARLVRWAKEELVLELTLTDTIDWAPGAVTVELDDGRRATVNVVVERSTAPGRYGPGLTVRLTLRADAPLAGSPAKVYVVLPGGALTLRLQA